MTSSSLVRAWQALAFIGALAAAAPGWAVTFDFEAPTYTAGALISQDNWGKNTYYGDMNGVVNVSATNPLSGSQSLSYEQTVAGGFSDVNRADALLVTPGVQGTDVTLSYTIKATANSFGTPVGGLFLQQVGGSGASPIFGRINGGVFEVGAAGAIVPVNDFFFSAGERLKVSYEIDFDTSNMNLILENLDFGEVFSQTYPFFAGYGAPAGPNGEYQVSVAAFLRGGVVQMDDITLTPGVGPLVTEYAWNATGSGNWNQAANWDPPGLPGTVAGRQKAILGNSITATETIFSNSTRNLNSLEINNANSYILAGTGSLEFQSDTSGPTTVAPTLKVLSGTHQVQLPVSLENNLSVTVSGGAAIDFNNQINLNGHTLVTSGTVRINHSTIGGGAVMNVGALMADGETEVGGDLISEGALVIGADEQGFGSFKVAGDAILSGILDVSWDASSLPAGSFAVVTADGNLDAEGLTLAADDAKSFALSVEQNSVVLTFLGVAVPEPSTFGMCVLGLLGFATRRRRHGLVRRAACAAAVTAVIGGASTASAINYNFENPPYTPGSIIGQQGWGTAGFVLADPFFGGVVNGTVEVSGNGPIAGSQSVLYTQTVDPPAAIGTGASDVARPFAVFGTEDGTDAFDLTASFQLKADSNAVGNGFVGLFLGEGGRSPIFLQVSNANSGAGTGDIQVGHDFAVPIVGSYVANSVYEFTLGIDLDNQNYEATARNVTAGTPAVTLAGPGPNGRFPFFGGAFGDDGDGQTYTFDTTMLLRSGVGRLDNINVVGDDFTQAVWNGGSGAWGQNAAWIPNMVPNASAGANGQLAIFGDRITSPQTVFTNTVQTVNGLRFDSAQKYAIAGGGSVALKANTIGGTVNPTVNVVSGVHELQVAVSVLDNTTVTVAAGAQLDFNNTVALGGKTLSTVGAVNLNVGVTGGGSIVNSGTLGTAGTTPVAANLTSTGTLQFDLGAANKDFFNITGSATLSGLVDIALEAGFTPTGSYTLLTSSGALNAAGLALTPSDASQFTLGVVGNNLVLTVGGSSFTPGDFNKDGSVNGVDLTKWQGDFAANGNSDADNDGDSDGSDFLIWQRNFGQASAVSTTATVPEPAGVALAAMACLGVGHLGRHRNRSSAN